MPSRERHLPTLLVDNVYMVRALIDVYHWTIDRRFLRYAELIAASMMQNLWSDEDGFLDRPIKKADTGMLKTLYSPFDENVKAADGFLRLNYLAGNEIYLEKAQAILNRVFHIYQNFGILASSYGLAVELHLHPAQVHIVGSRENPLTEQ